MSFTQREARRIVRKAVGRVPEGEEIRHLNIMPMMDMMTILLVAFIFQAAYWRMCPVRRVMADVRLQVLLSGRYTGGHLDSGKLWAKRSAALARYSAFLVFRPT